MSKLLQRWPVTIVASDKAGCLTVKCLVGTMLTPLSEKPPTENGARKTIGRLYRQWVFEVSKRGSLNFLDWLASDKGWAYPDTKPLVVDLADAVA